VMALAEPLVVLRPPMSNAALLRRTLAATGAWNEDEVDMWMNRVVRCGVSAISSSDVREAIGRGHGSPKRTSRGTPVSVAKYIAARGLYRPDSGPRGR